MTNVLLADEINRASPKTQSALLEAMEEKKVTVDGETYVLPDPFMVIATQNPSGYVGTYPLPEAQLDRFALKLSMGYPTEVEEMNIILQRKEANPLSAVEAVTSPEIIKAMSEEVKQVKVSGEICKYIVQLVSATRQSKSISLGASPRATLALMKLAQAYAYLDGRDYVIAEDIGALFTYVISHRIVLSQEARLNRKTAAEAVSEVFRSVEVPYRTGR
jgi:MoxR-like ATPase